MENWHTPHFTKTMKLFDDIRAQGAVFRLTEEVLYAEALREIEAGTRRDGLWAKALAESGGNQDLANAVYIKLRVRALRDEATLWLRQEQQQKGGADVQPPKPQVSQRLTPTPPSLPSGNSPLSQAIVALAIVFGIVFSLLAYFHDLSASRDTAIIAVVLSVLFAAAIVLALVMRAHALQERKLSRLAEKCGNRLSNSDVGGSNQ